eukprot:GEMP01110270.1.p1 GENE.GEMP01110270.1~~GEMP01110270.1.p1  ORF type:complete len:150 (-),score=22.83 GEMP01110270.1:128-577(-)
MLRSALRQRYTVGWPPEMTNHSFRGTHIHPGRERTQHGYSHPKKRDANKVQRYPNVAPKASRGDFHMGPQASGLWTWKAPYPPRVNVTTRPWPRLTKSIYNKPPPTEYPMRWKNIEYKMVPQLTRKPHGRNKWKYDVTRIVHGVDKNAA